MLGSFHTEVAISYTRHPQAATLIPSVQKAMEEEHAELEPMMREIVERIKNGEIKKINGCQNGWSYTAYVLEFFSNDRHWRIRIFRDTDFGFSPNYGVTGVSNYSGQHDKVVYAFSDKERADYFGQQKKIKV